MISQVNQEHIMFSGVTKTLTMPGGFKITIREINGDDEDKLSKLADSKDGSAIHKFLSGLIIGNSINPEKRVTEEDVASWRIRDKYYALYWVIRHSHGNKCTYRHTFADGNEFGFDQDLAVFDWDLESGTKPPKLGETGYNPKVIQPYPEDSMITGQTSTGKKFRMGFLTGVDELGSLGKNPDDLSINEKLRMRNFELNVSGSWVQMQNFASFSAREMKEIRHTLEKEDPEFNLNLEVRHPKTGQKEVISLLSLPDFFFPAV